MSRIFKQLGHGYGASPVTITAQIDGNTIFSGTIPTTDTPLPGIADEVFVVTRLPSKQK